MAESEASWGNDYDHRGYDHGYDHGRYGDYNNGYRGDNYDGRRGNGFHWSDLIPKVSSMAESEVVESGVKNNSTGSA